MTKRKKAAPGKKGRKDINIRYRPTCDLAVAIADLADKSACNGAEVIIACGFVIAQAGADE